MIIYNIGFKNCEDKEENVELRTKNTTTKEEDLNKLCNFILRLNKKKQIKKILYIKQEKMIELYEFKKDKKPYQVMSREEAEAEFYEAMNATDGSEQDRMTLCYIAIINGATKIYLYNDDEI